MPDLKVLTWWETVLILLLFVLLYIPEWNLYCTYTDNRDKTLQYDEIRPYWMIWKYLVMAILCNLTILPIITFKSTLSDINSSSQYSFQWTARVSSQSNQPPKKLEKDPSPNHESQVLLTTWELRLTRSATRKHPITVFLLWHDFHYPCSSQHRAAEQGSSCLSHLTGMACGLCNRAKWVRAGRCPSVTVAPGGAIFSSFASSCVSLAACQSDERYFLWVTALLSFVNPEPRRP